MFRAKNIKTAPSPKSGEEFKQSKSTLASAHISGLFQPDSTLVLSKIETEEITDQLKNTTTLDNLLKFIVYGNQNAAKSIIEIDPNVLLKRGSAMDYSGRTIEGTPYQMALGAQDYNMAEMISSYFSSIKKLDAPVEIQKQYSEQFLENDEGLYLPYSYTALMNKIVESKNDEDCEDELGVFRANFKSHNEIRTGLHFNVQLLTDAFELYIKYYENFGGYNSRKNNLFWCQVVGYIQRFLPAHYAQAFCQGLNHVAKKSDVLNRSLKFKDDSVYFPLELGNEGLGFDFCAGYSSIPRTWSMHWGSSKQSANATTAFWKNYLAHIQNCNDILYGQLALDKPKNWGK